MGGLYMPTFIPSDPKDRLRTMAELNDWEQTIKKAKESEKRENRRFIITTVLSGIAALAAVAGVIIQLA
jgi:hypothetical protein